MYSTRVERNAVDDVALLVADEVRVLPALVAVPDLADKHFGVNVLVFRVRLREDVLAEGEAELDVRDVVLRFELLEDLFG